MKGLIAPKHTQLIKVQGSERVFMPSSREEVCGSVCATAGAHCTMTLDPVFQDPALGQFLGTLSHPPVTALSASLAEFLSQPPCQPR